MSQQCLCRYEKDGNEFLKKVVTCGEIRVWHYELKSKRQSMEWKHVGSPLKKKFKSQRSTRKVSDAYRFGDMQSPITISFFHKGSFVNSANYCELLKHVKKIIKNKRRGHQSEGVILHHDNARPYTADHQQPGLETAPSSPLIAQTLPFQTSPVSFLERIHERHEV